MLTIFKNGRFDEFLEKMTSMTDEQFQDVDLMTSLSEEYDTFMS